MSPAGVAVTRCGLRAQGLTFMRSIEIRTRLPEVIAAANRLGLTLNADVVDLETETPPSLGSRHTTWSLSSTICIGP